MSTLETQAINLPAVGDEVPSGPALFTGQSALPFLGNLKVRLTAQLGAADISVAELAALKKGATLSLDKLLDQPIDLLAEGHVVAQGTLVAVDDNFGLRITSAPKLA